MAHNLEILIVDDSRTSRMLATAFIKAQAPAATIREAASADDARDVLKTHTPALIILDMHMPGMSGLELAREIETTTPNAVRVLLTANIQDALKRQAEELRVHFFKKPISEQVISEILALVI